MVEYFELEIPHPTNPDLLDLFKGDLTLTGDFCGSYGLYLNRKSKLLLLGSSLTSGGFFEGLCVAWDFNQTDTTVYYGQMMNNMK
jgi:hypothetical protein